KDGRAGKIDTVIQVEDFAIPYRVQSFPTRQLFQALLSDLRSLQQHDEFRLADHQGFKTDTRPLRRQIGSDRPAARNLDQFGNKSAPASSEEGIGPDQIEDTRRWLACGAVMNGQLPFAQASQQRSGLLLAMDGLPDAGDREIYAGHSVR